MESNKRNKAKKPKVAKEIDFDLLEQELVKKKKGGGNNGKCRNDRNKSKRNYQQTRKHY